MKKLLQSFKDRWRVVVALILLCTILLSGILFLNGLIKKESITFSSKILVFPEKYALTMSSTPGIRVLLKYDGTADKVEYSATNGTLLMWDQESGKISEHGQKVELPITKPVYWSPLVSGKTEEIGGAVVKAKIIDKDKILAEKLLKIKFDNETLLYSVIPDNDVIITGGTTTKTEGPKTIDEAVSLAIKGQGKGYGPGEFSAEGHIILDTETKGDTVKVYTIASYGAFGFEDGIFTKVSGSGAVSTVVTFTLNGEGEYILKEVREPMDGSENLKSKKEMFPRRLWSKVISEHKYYPELAKQQEEQAKQYLVSIGKNAEVSERHVERKLPEINVQASNKLFAELTKYDSELNNFPYWIGTKELMENGVRYTYETSQGKTDDGYDLMIFRKTKDDGTLVKEYRYRIEGEEPKLISEK